MKLIKCLITLSFLMVCLGACSGSQLETKTQLQSYAAGVQLAESFKTSKIKLDPDAVRLAIQDVNGGKGLKLTEADLKEWQYRTTQEASEVQKVSSETNLVEAKTILENYMKQEGVKRTKSGLLYKVLTPGKGRRVTEESKVTLDYTGKLTNDKVFDSSVLRGRPAEFALKHLIPGLREALLQMRVGQKMEVLIPPNLGYGPSGTKSVPGNSALKFELHVLGVK